MSECILCAQNVCTKNAKNTYTHATVHIPMDTAKGASHTCTCPGLPSGIPGISRVQGVGLGLGFRA